MLPGDSRLKVRISSRGQIVSRAQIRWFRFPSELSGKQARSTHRQPPACGSGEPGYNDRIFRTSTLDEHLDHQSIRGPGVVCSRSSKRSESSAEEVRFERLELLARRF